MGKLVTNPSRPSWVCWLAHVKQLRFCASESFDVRTAGAHLDELDKDFRDKFENVKLWATYHKPKIHLPVHFREVRFPRAHRHYTALGQCVQA